MTNKSALSKLTDKALESTIGLLVVFMISTALIGGTGYIFVGARAELHDIERDINAAASKSELLQAYLSNNIQLLNHVDFTPYAGRSAEIINALGKVLPPNSLNPEFEQVASKWCEDSIDTVAQKKTEVQALVLATDLQKRFQTNIVEMYDYETERLALLSTNIKNWNKMSVEEKTEFFKQLGGIQNKQLSDMTALSIVMNQLDTERANKSNDGNRQHDEVIARFEMLNTRENIAFAGAVGGLLVLFCLFILLIYKISRR
jgi:hypothetical protein